MHDSHRFRICCFISPLLGISYRYHDESAKYKIEYDDGSKKWEDIPDVEFTDDMEDANGTSGVPKTEKSM